jgi:quinolinate synthetase A
MNSPVNVVEIDYPFPQIPAPLSAERKQELTARIAELLKARNAVLIAHYYTDHDIQALAKRQAGLSAIRWKWRSLVNSMPRKRSSLRVCALWVSQRRS